MHFLASSKWRRICFGYQWIIFNGEKVLKFSQIEAVSLTAFSQFFWRLPLFELNILDLKSKQQNGFSLKFMGPTCKMWTFRFKPEWVFQREKCQPGCVEGATQTQLGTPPEETTEAPDGERQCTMGFGLKRSVNRKMSTSPLILRGNVTFTF